MTPALACIVAMARGRAIGLRGQLPWRIPEDLKRFKALTMGHAIIMGRATYDSIGKPLPGRRNVVLSRQVKAIAGCEVFSKMDEALQAVRDDPMPFIIGGAAVYAESWPKVTHLFLTDIDREVEADAFFPEVALSNWKEVSRLKAQTPDVTFIDLVRKDVT